MLRNGVTACPLCSNCTHPYPSSPYHSTHIRTCLCHLCWACTSRLVVATTVLTSCHSTSQLCAFRSNCSLHHSSSCDGWPCRQPWGRDGCWSWPSLPHTRSKRMRQVVPELSVKKKMISYWIPDICESMTRCSSVKGLASVIKRFNAHETKLRCTCCQRNPSGITCA